jgi:hypothetical protein
MREKKKAPAFSPIASCMAFSPIASCMAVGGRSPQPICSMVPATILTCNDNKCKPTEGAVTVQEPASC